MERRTLLQTLAAMVAAGRVRGLKLFAQAPPLADTDVGTLSAIAEVVLPGELGRDGREREVTRFVAWIRNYREGAERGGGYGNAQLTPPTGPSPARNYSAQLAALEQAARDQGAASLSALSIDRRRAIVEAALNTPSRVTALPQRPTGANVVADLMGHYFNSAAAFDLCYRAAIGRDDCRGLEGSDQPPAHRQGAPSGALGGPRGRGAPRA